FLAGRPAVGSCSRVPLFGVGGWNYEEVVFGSSLAAGCRAFRRWVGGSGVAYDLPPAGRRGGAKGERARTSDPAEPGFLGPPRRRGDGPSRPASLAARLLAKSAPGGRLFEGRSDRRLPSCAQRDPRVAPVAPGSPSGSARSGR